MCTPTQIGVAAALLPPHLLQELTTPQAREKQMTATAALIVNLIRESFKSIVRRNIRELDANPGDKGCQLRAVLLRELLLSPAIQQEVKKVAGLLNPIENFINARKSRILRFNEGPPHLFFQKHIVQIEVSVDLLYLIYCKLLTVTKVKHHQEENGIIVTHLDYGKLSAICQDIPQIDKSFREQMICDASVKLSEESLTRIQFLAQSIKVSPLLLRMLMGVRQNQPPPGYKPKSFGCQFHTVQFALTYLCQQKAFVAIKTIVKEGHPQLLLLQSPCPGEEFQFIEGAPLDQLIVVFEGVVRPGLSIADFKQRVLEIGFSKLVLACASKEEPYEHGSTLEQVADAEGRAEIETYRKIALEIGCGANPLILLDHIFCNSLAAELKTGAKPC